MAAIKKNHSSELLVVKKTEREEKVKAIQTMAPKIKSLTILGFLLENSFKSMLKEFVKTSKLNH